VGVGKRRTLLINRRGLTTRKCHQPFDFFDLRIRFRRPRHIFNQPDLDFVAARCPDIGRNGAFDAQEPLLRIHLIFSITAGGSLGLR